MCSNEATDCIERYECEFATQEEKQLCSGMSGGGRCYGDVSVECDSVSDDLNAWDCGAAGLVCVEYGRLASCGHAECDLLSYEAYCHGNLLHTCREKWSTEWVVDCSGSGGVCELDLDNNAYCVGTGDPCDEESFDEHCDGSEQVFCLGGKESRIDCSLLNQDAVCVEEYGLPICMFGSECEIHSNEECNDGVITFCMLGKVMDLDCREFGYSGCNTNDYYGMTGAYCVP